MSKESWDQRYTRGETEDLPPDPLVLRAASLLPPGAALDIACGRGRHSLALARQGWDVTAVDYSASALAYLRQQADLSRLPVKTVQADLEAGEFELLPSSFRLICDCCYLQRSLFAPIRAALQPGGLFVAILRLQGPSGADGSINPAYTAAPGELREEFRGWDLEHYFEGRPNQDPERSLRAEIIVRKPE